MLVYHTATTARNVCNIIVRADEISAYYFDVAAFHCPRLLACETSRLRAQSPLSVGMLLNYLFRRYCLFIAGVLFASLKLLS